MNAAGECWPEYWRLPRAERERIKEEKRRIKEERRLRRVEADDWEYDDILWVIETGFQIELNHVLGMKAQVLERIREQELEECVREVKAR
jgi:hypothetical protein